MKNFAYYRPKSASQAIALLDDRWGTSELLAGGTDLLDLQKEYVAQPDKVISLRDLGKEFTSIEYGRSVHVIGAGMKLADIASDKMLRRDCPALTTAAGDIGGPQIRNMGTLGGNLCQRNRCWYFRDEHTHCLLKGGDKCFAIDGENRYHAFFTQGHKCVIVNPSTLAPALIALQATATVQGPKGKREIALEKFFHAPSSASEREHVLAPNEMVLSVRLRWFPAVKNASYEVRHKQSYDWPLVQAAVAFKYEENKATDVRIVLGHVAPTPHVAEAAAKALEGKEVTEETASAAGEAATEGAMPLSQTGYKAKLVAVAVKRALLTAAGQKKYWEA
ncbi:MAG TPA: xanthine dehydrogenase family protein subunit M [Gemmataceae bacterium]|nr:xanthine dehydrogenase family protein subunit M [Gemmataceae bacterium]